MIDMGLRMNWQEGTGLPAPFIEAIDEIVAYLAGKRGLDALLLTGSWARGKGVPGADADLVLLHDQEFDRAAEMAAYDAWFAEHSPRWGLERFGPFSFVELEPHDGHFTPVPRHWTSGPDNFELDIGNTLVYTRPIATWTDRLERLRAQWLPYYGEELRRERLAAAAMYARNNLAHIPPFSHRGLYFQCLKRLHHALEETLQALFIAARRYPIAYDKWIEEQVVDILKRPDLYATFVQVVTIPALDAATLQERADLLVAVLDAEIPGS